MICFQIRINNIALLLKISTYPDFLTCFLLKIISYWETLSFIKKKKVKERQLLIDLNFLFFYFYSGTGYEVWGNCNAPRAVTLSAIIYCLRCIVGRDVPLNQV